MDKPQLILTVGNIASGKSTWIKNFVKAEACMEQRGWIVISPDDIRRMIGAGSYIFRETLESTIHTCILNILSNFMVHDYNIIIDDNNVEKSYRDAYINFTTKRHNIGYDYEVIAAIMPKISKIKSVARRVADSETYDTGNAQHWNNVWDFFDSRYEEPTKEEGFDSIWRIRL